MAQKESATTEEQAVNILSEAVCPRCGGAVKQVSVIRENRETVGYRVQHDDPDPRCSRKEWPVFDPSAFDSELNQRGGGLSICHTCFSTVQHIDVIEEGEDAGTLGVVEPERDDDGNVICHLCASYRGISRRRG